MKILILRIKIWLYRKLMLRDIRKARECMINDRFASRWIYQSRADYYCNRKRELNKELIKLNMAKRFGH